MKRGIEFLLTALMAAALTAGPMVQSASAWPKFGYWLGTKHRAENQFTLAKNNVSGGNPVYGTFNPGKSSVSPESSYWVVNSPTNFGRVDILINTDYSFKADITLKGRSSPKYTVQGSTINNSDGDILSNLIIDSVTDYKTNEDLGNVDLGVKVLLGAITPLLGTRAEKVREGKASLDF